MNSDTSYNVGESCEGVTLREISQTEKGKHCVTDSTSGRVLEQSHSQRQKVWGLGGR